MLSTIAILTLATPLQQTAPVELRPIDMSGWQYANETRGSSPATSSIQRNMQKNRPWTDKRSKVDWSFAKFVDTMQAYDTGLNLTGNTRSDLDENARLMSFIQAYEDRLVAVTGYLVLAYGTGPESTNYDSTKFHDWHLELYERPLTRPPRPGDPTPIICEITRFTERKLYDKGIRLQKLISVWSTETNGKIKYRLTGHPPHKVRITGYLLWDDSHNVAGKDIGPKMRIAPPDGYRHPWRRTAWEVHPVTNIEDLGR
ncbi:MAG: hypothetical protein QOJ65_638 [Fimbriimonadaceae bacterium]|nr:hypothetical protein [Fimbriimonadaceae bacterium]